MATGRDRVVLQNRGAAARRSGIPFTVDIDAFPNSPAVCPCCGVRMRRCEARRIAPSLDRLVPALGYVDGNVLWVCWLCNTTKSNHTLAELYRVADFYHEEYKRRGIPCPTRGAENEDTRPREQDALDPWGF